MKSKISRILGVALTLAVLSSLCIVAAPASAATQAWDAFTTPSTTGMMLNTTITAGGPIAQSPVDGALYAYVLDGGTNKLIKSTDGGRTWKVSGSVGQPTAAVVAIAPSPVEANVVFYATASTLYRSNDGGANFTTVLNGPTSEVITALDVTKYGGRYVAVVGTDNATASGGVLFWDENDIFNNLNPVGTTSFGYPVLALALAPTFTTDRALVAIGIDGTNNMAIVRTNVNGGAWDAVVGPVRLTTTSPIAPSLTAPTAADIAFPSDYNATTNPVYFACVSDADAADGGVYRLIGTTATRIDTGLTWTNLAVNGAFGPGNTTILVGSSAGAVIKSTNAGFSFSSVTLRSSVAAPAWVLLDKDYATNGKAYVLNLGAAGGALNVSIDGMVFFNQWSLINVTITGITDLAVAANGDMFMITAGSNTSIFRYYGGVWERVNQGTTNNMVRVSPTYATDKAVMLATNGSAAAILISTNNANSFTAMASAPGSIVLPADAVYSLLPLSSSTVVVGSAAGIITTNTSSYWWVESSPFGAGYTVTDIRQASNGDLLAVAQNGATVKAAKSIDGGASWTVFTASLTSTSTNAFIAPAADYAATGNVFLAVDGGVYRATATATSWTLVDGGGLVAAAGLITTPGGPGSSAEGSGMVYMTDGNTLSTARVGRIRGLSTTAETVLPVGSVTTYFLSLAAAPATVGNVQLFAVGNDAKIYTYTDTLNVAGSGVAVSAVTQTTATVKWNKLTSATAYQVFVSATAQNNFYTAASDAGITVAVNSTTQTATVSGLIPNTQYYVSVWASTPVSSFLFGGVAKSFQTLPAAPVAPPVNLIPNNGAQNQPINDLAFAWSAPSGGADSYTWQLTTDPTFGTITEGEQNTTLTYLVWAGPLEYDTSYYWRVSSHTTAGDSPWVTSVFSTVAEPTPPVTVPPAPTPTIVLPTPTVTVVPPIVTETVLPTPTVTVVPPEVTSTILPTPIIQLPKEATPVYIWAIVAIGAVLTIAVVILIVRTRRVV